MPAAKLVNTTEVAEALISDVLKLVVDGKYLGPDTSNFIVGVPPTFSKTSVKVPVDPRTQNIQAAQPMEVDFPYTQILFEGTPVGDLQIPVTHAMCVVMNQEMITRDPISIEYTAVVSLNDTPDPQVMQYLAAGLPMTAIRGFMQLKWKSDAETAEVVMQGPIGTMLIVVPLRK